MNDINVYLVRHAQSLANALTEDLIGQDNDTPLTKLGVNQAEKLGSRFSNQGIIFDEIISSTYLRAKTTAEIVAIIAKYKKPITMTEALVEYNPGLWKGRKRAEIHADEKTVRAMSYQNMGFLFPGDHGESYHKVERRAATFIENHIIHNKDVLAKAEENELNIGVFTHGMTAKCVLHYILGFSSDMLWKVRIGNTSVSHFVFNDKGWFVNSINDQGHLL